VCVERESVYLVVEKEREGSERERGEREGERRERERESARAREEKERRREERETYAALCRHLQIETKGERRREKSERSD